MATPKALNALKKTKEAIDDIKAKLEPVVQRLRDDAFDKATAQAQATVSLSLGMMKYMGARLQGLDHGRKSDDALRQELNQMRKVLAEIKARNGSTTTKPTSKTKISNGPPATKPSKKAKKDAFKGSNASGNHKRKVGEKTETTSSKKNLSNKKRKSR